MVVYNCYIGHVAGLLPLRSRAAAGSSERRRRGWACVCVCCGGEDPGSATGAAAGSLMESAPMSHGPWRGRPIYKCSGAGGRTCAPLDMNFSISSGGMYPCAAAPGVSAPRGLADAAASGGGRPRQKEAGWGWRRERAQSGQVAGGRCSRRSGRWQQRVRTRAAGEGGGAQQQKTWRQGGAAARRAWLLPGRGGYRFAALGLAEGAVGALGRRELPAAVGQHLRRRREFCHSAANPSPFSRRFDRDGERVSVKRQNSRRTASTGAPSRTTADPGWPAGPGPPTARPGSPCCEGRGKGALSLFCTLLTGWRRRRRRLHSAISGVISPATSRSADRLVLDV